MSLLSGNLSSRMKLIIACISLLFIFSKTNFASKEIVYESIAVQKNHARILKTPSKFFFSRNKGISSQPNGTSEGMVLYKDPSLYERTFRAGAKLSLATDRIRDRDYQERVARLDTFIDLKKPFTGDIVKREAVGPVITTVSLIIDHDGIMELLSKRDRLMPYINTQKNDQTMTVKKYKKIEGVFRKFMCELTELNIQLSMQKSGDDSKVAHMLRKVLSSVRKNYHVMKAVEATVPGALEVYVELTGVHINPIIRRIAIN